MDSKIKNDVMSFLESKDSEEIMGLLQNAMTMKSLTIIKDFINEFEGNDARDVFIIPILAKIIVDAYDVLTIMLKEKENVTGCDLIKSLNTVLQNIINLHEKSMDNGYECSTKDHESKTIN